MTAIVLLFVAGTILLAAEVMLPGAVAGIMGGLALLSGSALAFSEFGLLAGGLATLGAVVLLAVMLWVELVWLPRSRLGRDMVVASAVDAQSQPPVASPEVIGSTATAVTPLVPTGYVMIDGRRYEAFCRTGHAPKGAVLKVVGLDNFRVIVSQVFNS